MSERDVTKDGFATALLPSEQIGGSRFRARVNVEGKNFDELVNSIKKHGIIEPLVVRPTHGEPPYELVAGERRLRAARKAGLHMFPVVIRDVSEDDGFLLQQTENLHRNGLEEEDKVRLVSFCAEKKGWKTKEIAENLGMGTDWVLKYLPDKFKDQNKVEAGRVGGQVTQERKVLDAVKQNLGECERCHVNNHLELWNGHNLCPECHGKAMQNPTVWKEYFDRMNKGKKALDKVKEKATEEKPKTPFQLSTWEYRQGRQKVQHSAMEDLIVKKLRAKGYSIETDIAIVVYEVATTPDFIMYLHNGKKLYGYVDGPPHEGKEDEDKQLRDLLHKKFPTDKIASVKTKGDSDREADEKVAEIEEELKWL